MGRAFRRIKSRNGSLCMVVNSDVLLYTFIYIMKERGIFVNGYDEKFCNANQLLTTYYKDMKCFVDFTTLKNC